jgi:hypothetical protein
MRKVWGLYSSRVDYYCANELIELFESEEQANQARDLLFGKLIYRDVSWRWRGDPDDPEFGDLHVIEKNLR